MELKVGDKVLICDKVSDCRFGDTKMDKFCNKIMTIRLYNNDNCFYMLEDIDDFHGNVRSGWIWDNSMIIRKADI